jgi:hypothetical protein
MSHKTASRWSRLGATLALIVGATEGAATAPTPPAGQDADLAISRASSIRARLLHTRPTGSASKPAMVAQWANWSNYWSNY